MSDKIRAIIEAANPCNVCSPEMLRTCESLGRCNTRDAWRTVVVEMTVREGILDAAAALLDNVTYRLIDKTGFAGRHANLVAAFEVLQNREKEGLR